MNCIVKQVNDDLSQSTFICRERDIEPFFSLKLQLNFSLIELYLIIVLNVFQNILKGKLIVLKKELLCFDVGKIHDVMN